MYVVKTLDESELLQRKEVAHTLAEKKAGQPPAHRQALRGLPDDPRPQLRARALRRCTSCRRPWCHCTLVPLSVVPSSCQCLPVASRCQWLSVALPTSSQRSEHFA
ncbi:hypothetical protein PHYPSEUDO_007228 [Phytophthora pseudosyringae]|uniref:Uncharacterized protein n=1 Tax=Phytophthora pseudosyringae TaxID=221518 RepID=A0A8T1VGH8_9STRA|nr:hypothetical protein PHYPSEUDO_007228 [Phytophthora pseudosyringae]